MFLMGSSSIRIPKGESVYVNQGTSITLTLRVALYAVGFTIRRL